MMKQQQMHVSANKAVAAQGTTIQRVLELQLQEAKAIVMITMIRTTKIMTTIMTYRRAFLESTKVSVL